jgi:hypothetical protein
MLTVYFDESFEAGNGHVVVAGFMGNKESWVKCAQEWRVALATKQSLHMKTLRWKYPNRNKKLLEDLGAVPHACGLQPFFASVKLSEYRIAQHVPKTFQNGYFVSLCVAVMALLANLPRGERLELIFEQQHQYAAVREAALEVISRLPVYRVKRRKMLAKWSSSIKSIFLEPSDYLAYAIMQTLVDKHSIRSKFCSPILSQGKKRIGGKLSHEQVAKIIPLMRKQTLIL